MVTKERIEEAKAALRGRHTANISRLQLGMHVSFMEGMELIDELERQGFCEKRTDPKTGIEKMVIVGGKDAEDCKEDGT